MEEFYTDFEITLWYTTFLDTEIHQHLYWIQCPDCQAVVHTNGYFRAIIKCLGVPKCLYRTTAMQYDVTERVHNYLWTPTQLHIMNS